MNSGPSHAKEYKVGVYPQYRMPRKGRTKPAAARAAGADRPRAAAAAQGLARRRGGVRPRCGSRARPPRAPPVRAARPPDTSVSTDHAAYDGPPIRGLCARIRRPGLSGARSPEPRFAAAPEPGRLDSLGGAAPPCRCRLPATSPRSRRRPIVSLHPKLGSHPCVTPAECAAERLRVPPSFSAL